MKILSRYILKEHAGPLVFALTTLTSLLLLNQVAKQFGRLVGKGLSWSIIGEFFLLSVPFIVAMSLPMAVLVAVLYAFSRLGTENEITALRATGVSILRLVRPVLAAALFVAGFMLYFNDQVLPKSNVRLATLQSDIARTKPTFALREQVINEVSPGRLYLRAARVDDATSALRGVTIYDLSDPMRRRTIHADSGLMALAPNRQDLQLTLYDGYSQEIPVEAPSQLQRVYFGVDLVRVRGVTSDFDRTQETVSRSEREMSICQMQENAERRHRDLVQARRTLANHLGGGAWRLATGQSRRFSSAEPVPERTTLPSLYCRYVTPAFAWRGPAKPSPAPEEEPGFRTPADEPRPRQLRESGLRGNEPASRLGGVESAPAESRLLGGENESREGRLGDGGSGGHALRAELARKPAPAERSRLAADRKRADGQLIEPALPVDSRALLSEVEAAPPVAAAMAGEAGDTLAGGWRGLRQVRDTVPEAVVPTYPQATGADSYVVEAVDPISAAAMIDMQRVQLTEARFALAKLTLEMHKKFALAAACVVFVLIGAPIALRFPRGGVGLVIGASLAVFSVYYVGLIAGESLADKLVLHPVLAMWLANIIFTILGAVLLWNARRGAATTRGGDVQELLDHVRTRAARLLGRPAPLRRASGEGAA